MKKANQNRYSIKTEKYLETARKLFLSKGYENTSVQNIIDELGVAKGTFYHYFSSKEALVDAMISNFADKFTVEIKALADRDDLDGLDKLNEYFRINREMKKADPELMMIFLKAMYNDNNILFRHKLHKKGVEKVLPEFIRILRQGSEEKIFDIDDPEETTEILMSIGNTYLDSLGNLMMRLKAEPEVIEIIEKKLKAYESALARLLGIDREKLVVIEPGFMDYFRRRKDA